MQEDTEQKKTATFRAIPLKDLGRKSFVVAIPTDAVEALQLDANKDPVIIVTIEVEKKV